LGLFWFLVNFLLWHLVFLQKLKQKRGKMPIVEAKEYKSFEEIKQTDENGAEFRFARGFIP